MMAFRRWSGSMVKTKGGSLWGVTLDKASGEALFVQLEGALRSAILSGRLAGNTRLPASRVIAADLKVSRNTVLHVFGRLIAEGLLYARTGSGTWVAPNSSPRKTTAHNPVRFGAAFARGLSGRGQTLVTANANGICERPRPFMPDLPDVRAFPIKAWARLSAEMAPAVVSKSLLSPPAAGQEDLRRAIASHIAATRAVIAGWRQVIVTTGSQQSLDLICRLLLNPEDPVWMEEPGYNGARTVFLANGARLTAVNVDADGLNPAMAGSGVLPVLLHVSPARQYPLGLTMQQKRRDDVLALARAMGCWIVEDDYEAEFRFSGAELPALQPMDPCRILYLGTFSKTLLPSLRLGYIVVPPDLMEAFVAARTALDRPATVFEQLVLAAFIKRGFFATHVRRMRKLYKSRKQLLAGRLENLEKEGFVIGRPEAGTDVILYSAPPFDDVAVAKTLQNCGLEARPLSIYYAGTAKTHGLILGAAGFNEAEIDAHAAFLTAEVLRLTRTSRAGRTNALS